MASSTATKLRLVPPPSAQDAYNAAGIASAVAWSATIFANRRHNTFRFATRAEAEECARTASGLATNGRRAMVYAITPEGFSIYAGTP